MKVLRAAVVLGVSTPLVVLACGSDDGASSQRGAAGEGGEGAVAGSPTGLGGAAAGASGSPEGGGGGGNAATEGGASGASSVEGGAPNAGAGGASGGAGGAGGASGAGGAGGESSQGSCGDGSADGLVCFEAPLPLTLVEGTPSDLAIADWTGGTGLDLVVSSGGGLYYFAGDGAGGLGVETYRGAGGAVLGVGQLDSGSDLDLLLGQPNAGTSNIVFGDGAGAVTTTETSGFQSEGVLYNYFVADVAGSESQDIVVTFNNSMSVVLTTGTEGEGFQGQLVPLYPTTPLDGVVAQLGSAKWLVYSANGSIHRQLLTYDEGSLALGAPLDTPVGAAPAQLDVGDFNEDGFDDVAATVEESLSARVLFGSGTGTGGFALVSGAESFLTLTIGTTDAAKTQRDVKVGDFNGDAHADVAVTVSGLDSVAIFSGDGEGGFTGPTLVSTGTGSGPTRLAVGDLNGDGASDLAVVGGASNKIIVLLSEP